MKKISSLGLKTLKIWKLFLSLILSVSTPSTLHSSFSLPLSPSQLPLAVATPSLPLARSGGYGTPRYSGDHWKSSKEISLSSPPFNFRNFGFGFGFWVFESWFFCSWWVCCCVCEIVVGLGWCLDCDCDCDCDFCFDFVFGLLLVFVESFGYTVNGELLIQRIFPFRWW